MKICQAIADLLDADKQTGKPTKLLVAFSQLCDRA
jgi:hypothetical protein